VISRRVARGNVVRWSAVLALLPLLLLTGCGTSAEAVSDDTEGSVSLNKLTPEEEAVIVHKGTELPFSGEYWNSKGEGTYVCRRCGALLYRSSDKFDSGCGWPSFDDEIPGAVKRVPDVDGRRTEILCAACGAHLGHVFEGEQLTDKNIRHCVNSISLKFVPAGEEAAGEDEQGEDPGDTKAGAGTKAGEIGDAAAQAASPASEEGVAGEARAYFAGGCFWGVEYMFQSVPGVLDVRSGYMGGTTENPTYREVCGGTTGHAETVEVRFDPRVVSYEELAKLFFEIHDPTQVDRQGPDRGAQYRSAVFYVDDAQKRVAEKLIRILKGKGYDVATEVTPAGPFWAAEDYHQDYYDNKGGHPYCHTRQTRF
jgi:peptide methionine sulfoxide reductase msrA/msrB